MWRRTAPAVAGPVLADDIAGHATAVLQSQEIAAAVTVGYTPNQPVKPAASAFADAAGGAGIQACESLRADDGRSWSCSCAR